MKNTVSDQISNSKDNTLSRRSFLKSSLAASTALCIGFAPDGSLMAAPAQAQAQAMLNPFVKIYPDGMVSVMIKHFEMGQGTTTGLTTLVAEELDADWEKTKAEFAPSDNKKYQNLLFGMQGTGGSTAIANSFKQYRMAGAAAKDIFIRAAAKKWGVDAGSVTVEKSLVKSGNHTAHFGELIEEAAKLTPVKEPKLKTPDQFTLIGKQDLPRKDNSGKINGTATFAMDVKVPNMVYACVLRSPKAGAKVKSFDASGAKEIKGFIDAKALPTKEGVVIYANSTWAAFQAKGEIEATWDFSKAETRSSDQMNKDHFDLFDKAPEYQAHAAMAFALLGGKKAVKLVWSREDDMAGEYYRPMAAHRVTVGLDDAGKINSWQHHIATQSILKGTPFEPMLVKEGIDNTAVEGLADPYYAIDNMALGLSYFQSPVKVLWWRSVGHTHTGYALEVMMDQIAKKLGKDPIDFRLALLSGDNKDRQRLAGVLKLVREKSGWDKPLPQGAARGVAVHKSFNSYVATVVEVSKNDDGAVKIGNITAAIDCGIVINPDVVKAQIEGGTGFGIGHVMRDQITYDEGEVEQTNFPDYEPLRIADLGKIDVHIVSSNEAPTGVGEPGVPPAGPALANAIFALTGKPLTTLPMTESDIEFA